MAGVFLACFVSCKEKEKPVAEGDRAELVKKERAFSELTRTKGYKAATLEFLLPDGVIMREGASPYIGSDAVDYLISLNDSGYQVLRSPLKTFLSASSDMGYTYGLYQINSSAAAPARGSYVTVWRKDEAGEWKIAVESTNFTE